MEEEHAQELAGKEQRIIALEQLHNERMDKLRAELKQMSRQLTSVRKTTNEVSMYLFEFFSPKTN